MNFADYLFENTRGMSKSLVVGKEELSYTEIYEHSSKLASYIHNKYGVNKNILILSVNNKFFLNVYLAILKSGNVCIPLDPKIEPDNLKYILEQTGSELVFLTPDVAKKHELKNIDCVLPDQLDGLAVGKEVALDSVGFNPENIAEIIFTSGSTGLPKGVMLSHKNLIANTNSIIEYLKLTENDRVMVVLPFFYCYGLSLLHTHMRVGGSIVMNNSFIFVGSVINDIKNSKCTGFAGVPSHFQILLRKTKAFKENSFPDLRYVTQAGGKLAPVFIDEFKEAFPETSFYVMYGQTEATARLSYLPPEEYELKRGSIGRGMPGVELKVVGDDGIPVKEGVVGEIIANGDNIMKGYLNDDQSTQQTIKNGWLHTGDLGTVDADGYIYLTARQKEIIKVGGKRISPKEIEEVILGIKGVVDCSIEAIEDEVLGEAIKAILVINGDNNITEELVKSHCAQNLALHKVPAQVTFEKQMVLSSSGKKTKQKL